MEQNNISETEQKQENSRIYVLFYSFFLIPFIIAVFGAVFFLLFKFITYETNDAEDLLNQVKVGSASKRWQSAFELAKVLNDPGGEPLSKSFKDQLATAYDRSIHDDPLNRLEKKDYPKWILSIYRKSFIKTLKYCADAVTTKMIYYCMVE